jgi:hypothetical protein
MAETKSTDETSPINGGELEASTLALNYAELSPS